MRRIFLAILTIALIVSIAIPGYAIVDWVRGDGTDAVLGTDNASDIDYDVTNYLQDPLDRLLANYVHGCTLTRTSATVVTIGIGEVVCSNGAGTIKRMRKNTATTTVDMAVVGVGGIDSGSAEVVSTWYSVYAVADANATTFTAICAQQGVALSDVTYYRYIGSFYNNAAGDISNFYWMGNGKNPLVMWDAPISVSTTYSGGWSAAVSCSSAMPSTSTCAIFALYEASTNNIQYVGVRPNGATTGQTYGGPAAYGSGYFKIQVLSMTSSSQEINFYNFAAAGGAFQGWVEGFYINR